MPTARDSARWGRRLLLGVAALAVAWFAVQGGEYGTTDLRRLRARRAVLEERLAALQREVDSLTAYRTAVQRDRATQERLAREAFGMVRGDRELLYRFAPPREPRSADTPPPPPQPSAASDPTGQRSARG